MNPANGVYDNSGSRIGAFDKEGNYLLEFDYNQDPELVMDILKYGTGVEVLAPTSLRKRVKDELTKALNNY
jgi:predicted DNA-binding transcriptional regulator YafY